MGTSPFPHLPGWYGDPDDPTQFRYWDGDTWTPERRRRPKWVEQQTKNVVAPVPARGSHAGRPTTPRPDVTLDGPARHLRPQDLRHYRPVAPVWPDNGSLPRHAPARRGWWREEPAPLSQSEPITPVGRLAASATRWPLIGFLLLSMLAMLGLATTVGLSSRSQQTFSAVATDTTFVSAANASCNAVLPGLRTVTQSAASSKVSTGSMSAPTKATRPQSTADQAGGTLGHLKVLAALRTKLAHLRANQAAAPYVRMWLGQWSHYITDRHQYLTETAGTTGRTELAKRAQTQANQADHFAMANGLGSCTLLDHPGSEVVSF